jgi:hypothetical protein
MGSPVICQSQIVMQMGSGVFLNDEAQASCVTTALLHRLCSKGR